MRKEKQVVKDFYDKYGWQKNEDGIYNDTATHVDRTLAQSSYFHRVHMRVKKFLKPSGEYFLDAGSGAIPHPEYLEYSEGYKSRVCVDLSKQALIEAKAKLDGKGHFILADLANLPFKDGAFDATVCAHVLYHVPGDEQESVVREIYRTLRRGGNCVIVYTWPSSFMTKLATGFTLREIIRAIPGARPLWKRIVKPAMREQPVRPQTQSGRPVLYAYAHNYRWFKTTLPKNWQVDIRCWRSVSSRFAARYIHEGRLGRLLLGTLFWIESAAPHIMVRIGQYPMIIIRKD